MASRKAWGHRTLGWLLVVLAACFFSVRASGRESSIQRLMTPAHVANYIRARWDIPATVGLTAAPLQSSPFAGFDEAKVTASPPGKPAETQAFLISKDGRCFISGPFFPMKNNSPQEVMRCIRQVAKLPASTPVELGAFNRSVFPGLLKASVTVTQAGKTDRGRIFITTDGRMGILGAVVPYSPQFTERLIDTRNQPYTGSLDAPVTIVEYADLECPHCALFQNYLEHDFIPRYGHEVRFIFKEFPLPGHPWSMEAALANECAYQIDPAAFTRYRTLIFASQDSIDLADVRDRLLGMGEQMGIDQLRLATCVDSQASRPRIEADVAEGETLGIMFTPTLFVNGHILVPNNPSDVATLVQRLLAEH
jgi:protein-disulfide isomerase